MKIAVFLPRSNPFYISMLFAIKRAFEDCGLEVFAATGLLEKDTLIEFCRQFRPNVIFEMNRTRNEIPELPREIKHIGWIVDLQGKSFNDFQESDILYLFGTCWREYHTSVNNGFVDWLAPGFCPTSYKPHRQNIASDCSFIGHIPLPWSNKELERKIRINRDTLVTFGQLYNQCVNDWTKQGGLHQLKPDEYLNIIYSNLKGINGKPTEITDRTIKYDIETRSTRILNRQLLINYALSSTRSLRIFGSDNFCEWSKYKQYYRGFLNDPQLISKVYQSSKLNLHEGIGLHFRSLDCMGSGGTLLYKSTSRDNHAEGINSHFEPYIHYIPIETTENSEIFSRYLHDNKERNKIGENAAKLAHEKHTWRHRCQKIIKDLKNI